MYLIYFIIFLAVNVITLPSVAQDCQFTFTPTAGDVFINFAKTQAGTKWQKEMGVSWPDHIRQYTKHWSYQDAEDFLDLFTQYTSADRILEKLRHTKDFNRTKYSGIPQRLNVYKKYLTKEDLEEYLSRSSWGLMNGKPEDIQANIEYLIQTIGVNATKNLLKKNWYPFTLCTPIELKQNVKLLEEETQNTHMVRMMLQQNLRAFTETTSSILTNNISFIKEYTGSEKMTRQMMQQNFYSFAIIKLPELKRVLQFLEEYTGSKDIVRQIMLHNLYDLSVANFQSLKTTTYFVENYIGSKAIVIRMMQQNLQAFSIAEPNILQYITRIIVNYIGNRAIVIQMMIKNLQDFSAAKPTHLLLMIEFLEAYSDKTVVIQMMQNDLHSLTIHSKLSRLKQNIAFMDSYIKDSHTVIQMMINSLEMFTVTPLSTLKEGVQFIEAYSHTHKIAIENIQSYLPYLAKSDFLSKMKQMEKQVGKKVFEEKIKTYSLRYWVTALLNEEKLLKKRKYENTNAFL